MTINVSAISEGTVMKVTEAIERGFWINPDSFYKNRVQDTVPDGCVIVTSEKVILDSGRTIFGSVFHLASRKGPQKVGKQEVSAILVTQMQKFMLEKKRWPPNTNIKHIYKNEKVKLEYTPDSYVVFNLIFPPEIEGKTTEDLLNSLTKEQEIDQETELVWKVEHAKSSRSTCQGCREYIQKGELRLGEPGFFQDHLTYKWYHLKCAQQQGFVVHPIVGLDTLTKEERVELERSGILNIQKDSL